MYNTQQNPTMSKRLYQPTASDMEESSSSSEDEQNDYSYSVRGGAGGGKQLRLTIQNSEESDSDAEGVTAPSSTVPVRMVGGKQLRYNQPQTTSDSDEDEEDEDEQVIVPRGGGKQLNRDRTQFGGKSLRTMAEADDDSSSSSEDEPNDEEVEDIDFDNADPSMLVKGKKDQEYLDSLTEMEREKILADRFEEKKREATLRKALSDSKRTESQVKPAKKKATKKTSAQVIKEATASLNRSTRNKDAVGSKAKKAGALAKLREEKAQQKVKSVDLESDSDLDYGSDEDSDEDYDDGTSKKRWGASAAQKKDLSSRVNREIDLDSSSEEEDEFKSEYIEAKLDDFQKVTISRHRLSLWCNEPFFENVVIGAFVRISIGIDKSNDKPCYRLCRIERVEVHNEYKFPKDKEGRQVVTNKWLILSFGKAEKKFRMIVASDGKPTQNDIDRYINHVKSEQGRGARVLSKHEANRIRKRQKVISENYTYTKEDIEKLVEEKKKRKGVKNIGLAKTKIEAEIKAAQAEVDECAQRIRNITDDLADSMYDDDDEPLQLREAKAMLKTAEDKLANRHDEKKKIFLAEQIRLAALKSSKIQKWERVNEQARVENQTADFESYKQRQLEEALKAEQTEFDPFARRKVKPKLLWEVGGGNEDESKPKDVDVVTTPQPPVLTSIPSNDEGEGKENIIQLQTEKPDVQFAIDEEAWAKRISKSSAFTDGDSSDYFVFKPQVRRGLSLAEYQERKAAGTL